MDKTFYVTTAIDYVNAEPHIGHAYQKIVADVFARWYRLIGKEVFFLTGTDEHGKKVANSAKERGLSPKEFTDKISQKFKEAWDSLNIKPDKFIRTTSEDHCRVVEEIIKRCDETGDIYKGDYEGLYCTGCEAYYTEKDCPDLVCPIHGKPLEKIKEETYFFRLSKYQDFLLSLYENHPEFILPKERRNEIVNRVKDGLKDFSITRTSFNWGIPFPLDEKHTTYVWFDALINYISGIGFLEDKEKFEKFWPCDLHILGKDNTWFHTVYWPAMLKSAGIEMPVSTFNHGFLSFNGQKISKSLGNAISPKMLAEKYGADSVRYFSMRQFPFASGEDGNFDEKSLIDRHNNELANKLGNLVLRVSSLAEKYGLEKDKGLDFEEVLIKVTEHFKNYELDKVLNEIFAFVDVCNEFIQEKKPWETKNAKDLYILANAIKNIAIVLSPFIPETSDKISKVFGFEVSFDTLKKYLEISKLKKAPVLFKKIEF